MLRSIPALTLVLVPTTTLGATPEVTEPAPTDPEARLEDTTESPEEPAPVAAALDDYAAQFIWFRHRVTINRQTGRVRTRLTPLKGKYGEPLDGAAFYSYVGRQDLADSYETTATLRQSFVIGGSVLALGGIIAGTIGTLGETDRCEEWRAGRCMQYVQGNTTQMAISFGIAGVGLAGVIAALFMEPHPAEPWEVREMADEFNKGLQRDLGLTDIEVVPEEPPVEASVSPVLRPGGGALALVVDF